MSKPPYSPDLGLYLLTAFFSVGAWNRRAVRVSLGWGLWPSDER